MMVSARDAQTSIAIRRDIDHSSSPSRDREGAGSAMVPRCTLIARRFRSLTVAARGLSEIGLKELCSEIEGVQRGLRLRLVIPAQTGIPFVWPHRRESRLLNRCIKNRWIPAFAGMT
jgi:hypothetical protein